MKAYSLNYRDLIILQGGYPRNEKSPVIPLSDGSGEVIEVGKGVDSLKVGQRVVTTFFQDWVSGDVSEEGLHSSLGGGLDGTLAEYGVFEEKGLLPIPENLSYEEAATLPCAALTAWQALVTLGNIKASDTILLLGTGGVSIFGLQFAKAFGAKTIITSSSDEKLKRTQELGADFTINYKTHPDWEKEVLRLTDGKGVTNVLEVGGPNTLEKSLQSVHNNGIISLIGVLAGFEGKISPTPLIFNRLRMNGIYVGSSEMFAAMNQKIKEKDLHPVIDKEFHFSAAKEAYLHLQAAKHFGKIVITQKS